jgi:hypothetical protein
LRFPTTCAAAPIPRSRHSAGSSAHKKANAPPEESAAAKKAAAAAEAEEAERFVGVREQKKLKKAKARNMEQDLDDMIAADPKLAAWPRTAFHYSPSCRHTAVHHSTFRQHFNALPNE